MVLLARPLVQATKGATGSKSGIMFGPEQYLLTAPGALTDGTSGDGAGWAGKGSMITRTDNGELYTNTGTKASPTWTNQT